MDNNKLKSDYNSKTIFFQMADYIAELYALIENVNVLTEDVYISLLNEIDLKTEKGRVTAQYELDISRTKSGMVRDFITQANEKVKQLIKLSDESAKIMNSSVNI